MAIITTLILGQQRLHYLPFKAGNSIKKLVQCLGSMYALTRISLIVRSPPADNEETSINFYVQICEYPLK